MIAQTTIFGPEGPIKLVRGTGCYVDTDNAIEFHQDETGDKVMIEWSDGFDRMLMDLEFAAEFAKALHLFVTDRMIALPSKQTLPDGRVVIEG